MISKKCFVSTMERLSQLDSAMDEVDTAMKKLMMIL